MDKRSKFMTDHSLGDKGKEAVLSFELSWVLRMAADDSYTKDKPIFFLYSKFMLFKVLGLEFPNSSRVVEVKVWKEWENIDLIVEVVIESDGCNETHVVMVENKVYTGMSERQRNYYPTVLNKFCDSRNLTDCPKRMVLLSCVEDDDKFNSLKDNCEGSGWEVMSIYEIILDLEIETESELFNEFWIYNWGRLDN